MIPRALPELSHVEPPVDAAAPARYVTVDGRTGVYYQLPPIDIEASDAGDRFDELSRFLSRLKPSVLCKLKARATPRSAAWSRRST